MILVFSAEFLIFFNNTFFLVFCAFGKVPKVNLISAISGKLFVSACARFSHSLVFHCAWNIDRYNLGKYPTYNM